MISTLASLRDRFNTRNEPTRQDFVDLIDTLAAIQANSVGSQELRNQSVTPAKMALGAANTFLRTNEAGDTVEWALAALRYMSASFAAVDADDLSSQNKFHITVNPAPTAYAFGQMYVMRAAKNNTGACTVRVGALGDVALKKNGSEDLAGGDISANVCYLLFHDGTNMQVLTGFGVGSGGSSLVVNAKPIFISPVEVAAGTAVVASPTTLDLSAYIPDGALGAILYCRLYAAAGDTENITYSIEARKDNASSLVPLLSGGVYDVGDATTIAGEDNSQVAAPLSASRTVDYKVSKTGTTSAFNWSIQVVGYYEGVAQVANASYEETVSQPLPTGASTLTFPHSLGKKPKVVRGVLECKIAEGPYVIGQEIELFSVNDSNDQPAFGVASDASDIIVDVKAGALDVDGNSLTRNAAPANNWALKFYLTDIISGVVTTQGNAIRQSESTLYEVPSSYVTAQEILFEHRLGITPTYFKCVLVCVDPELDFEEDEEVELACNSTARPYQMLSASATRLRLLLDEVPHLVDTSKTLTAITPAKWKLKFYAYDTLVGTYGVAVKKAESNLLSIPSANNTDAVQFAHGFAERPAFARVYLEAIASNNGYAIGDRVDITDAFVQSGGNLGGITTIMDDIYVTLRNAWVDYPVYLFPRTGAYTAFVALNADWNFRVVAFAHHRNPTSQRYVTPTLDMEALTTGANTVTESHGLDGVPDTMQWVAYCDSDDAGFVAGEEVNVEHFFADTGNDYAGAPAFRCKRSATEVSVGYHAGAAGDRIRVVSASVENGTTVIDVTKWKLRCYATKFI